MVMRFFKKNEKVIMVTLLALIAPTFAFTGLVYQFAASRNSALYEVFGQTLHQNDLAKLQNRVGQFKSVCMRCPTAYAVALGQGLQINPTQLGVTTPEALQHFTYLHEVKRLGLALSKDEKEQRLLSAAEDLVAIQTYSQVGGNFRNVRDAVQFDRAQYTAAVRGMRMTVKQFEELFLEFLLVEKLLSIVGNAAVVSTKDVYEEFLRQNEKRILEFVRVPVERFLDAAREAVSDQDIEQVYDEDPFVFERPLSIQLEVVKVKPETLATVVEPSDAEILERYERDKATLHLKGGEVSFATIEWEDDFLPLEDVSGQVIASIRKEKIELREQEILNTALENAKGLAATGDFEWEVAVGEDVAQVEIFKTEFFSENEIPTVDERFRNDAVLRELFLSPNRLKLDIEQGWVGEEVVNLNSGSYIFRVSAIRKRYVPLIKECRDEIVEVAKKEKALQLSQDHVKQWKEQVEAGTATFDGLVKDENYSIQT
ncbi:MAG: hypothetical protein V3T77_03775, partial [Planctomycetota bacterium]